MPRRIRRWKEDACYHVTHRCHERDFLLKFAKHRGLYLKLLQEASRRFRMEILNYMVTSNHIHLLLRTPKAAQTSAALQYVHGRIAQEYNHDKGREGAFWKDRFHCTRIQSGEHLRRCLLYIDMNMVRAGAVGSPLEWRHCGCAELHAGDRDARGIIRMESLLKCLGMDSVEEFRAWHAKAIANRLKRRAEMKREPFWSRAIAVGEKEWLSELSAKERFKGARISSCETASGEVNFLTGRSS